jgi:hypothetical protein
MPGLAKERAPLLLVVRLLDRRNRYGGSREAWPVTALNTKKAKMNALRSNENKILAPSYFAEEKLSDSYRYQ